MGILSRLVRLAKADAHGVMDQLEDKGLILSQCLRDMEEELGRAQNELSARRKQMEKLGKDMDGLSAQAEGFAKDARDAVSRQKDDMARHFLRRERVARKCLADLSGRGEELEKETARLAELCASRSEEYEKLKIRADHYMAMAAAAGPERPFTDGPAPGFSPDEQEVELALLRLKEDLAGGAS